MSFLVEYEEIVIVFTPWATKEFCSVPYDRNSYWDYFDGIVCL